MEIKIPEGVYTMKDRLSILKNNASKYRKSSKKIKSIMLDELSEILSMNRKYIAYLLSNTGKVIHTKYGVRVIGDPTKSYVHMRGRKKIYKKEEILPLLRVLWEKSGRCSSKHLYYYIQYNRDKIFTDIEEMRDISLELKEKLLRISAATIDRLLKEERDKLKLRGKYRGNPFNSRIKVITPEEGYWSEDRGVLGYVEIDTVHHCGEKLVGEFAYTMTAVEVNTDWVELRVLRNKAMRWTGEAIMDIERSMPFKIYKIHTDNGTEFLNYHIERICKEMGIERSRSRPYHKNDNPYVESRNWNLVRRYLGYRRYDTEEEIRIMDKLLRAISDMHNYFMPTMKVKRKERVRGKVRKEYDIKIPYMRVLEREEVDEREKERIKKKREELNMDELYHRIERLIRKLDRVHRKKYIL